VRDYDELKALIEKRGVHAEFGDAGEGWGIEQSPHELATFLVRMQELDVQSVLEIGTGYKGGLSRFLAHDLGWDVTTYDIQNYGHIFTGVHYIVGDETWANVEYPHFLEKFDLVFIDANHAYDEVLFDFDYYGKYASKVIALHDIAGLRDCEGVALLWNQIQQSSGVWPSVKSDRHEIIAPDKQSGIGWIEL
jgi:hypothetical protein